MKTYPVDTKTLTEFRVAHLFDIELSQLELKASAAQNSSFLVVNDVDKCWVGLTETNSMNISYSNGTLIYIGVVKSINRYLNQIELYDPLEIALSSGDIICETIYTAADLPKVADAGGGYVNDYLELYHSAYGTLDGFMHLTDYDRVIVTPTDRPVYNRNVVNKNGMVAYIPAPIGFKDIGVEQRGKTTSVEITAANQDQLLGGIILRMNGLKKRNIIIKTVFFDDDCVPYHIMVTMVDSVNKINTILSRTTSYSAVWTLNGYWNMYMYCPAVNIVTDFCGRVDSSSFSDESINITATLVVDNAVGIQIPRRIFSRVRCPFIYKGPQCRFRALLWLTDDIDDSQTTIPVGSDRPYFSEMNVGESHVIRIGSEEMLVTAYVSATPSTDLSQFTLREYVRSHGQLPPTYNGITYTVVRAYGGSANVAHSENAAIDIMLCRKTEHDCRLHCNMPCFGAFPAIAKNKTMTS